MLDQTFLGWHFQNLMTDTNYIVQLAYYDIESITGGSGSGVQCFKTVSFYQLLCIVQYGRVEYIENRKHGVRREYNLD